MSIEQDLRFVESGLPKALHIPPLEQQALSKAIQSYEERFPNVVRDNPLLAEAASIICKLSQKRDVWATITPYDGCWLKADLRRPAHHILNLNFFMAALEIQDQKVTQRIQRHQARGIPALSLDARELYRTRILLAKFDTERFIAYTSREIQQISGVNADGSLSTYDGS